MKVRNSRISATNPARFAGVDEKRKKTFWEYFIKPEALFHL